MRRAYEAIWGAVPRCAGSVYCCGEGKRGALTSVKALEAVVGRSCRCSLQPWRSTPPDATIHPRRASVCMHCMYINERVPTVPCSRDAGVQEQHMTPAAQAHTAPSAPTTSCSLLGDQTMSTFRATHLGQLLTPCRLEARLRYRW